MLAVNLNKWAKNYISLYHTNAKVPKRHTQTFEDLFIFYAAYCNCFPTQMKAVCGCSTLLLLCMVLTEIAVVVTEEPGSLVMRARGQGRTPNGKRRQVSRYIQSVLISSNFTGLLLKQPRQNVINKVCHSAGYDRSKSSRVFNPHSSTGTAESGDQVGTGHVHLERNTRPQDGRKGWQK